MGLLISLDSAYSLVATSSQHLRIVDGWASAKEALRDPNCCVVSITGFEDHLQVLQDEWADGGGPADIDLRARVRVPSIGDTTSSRIAAMTSITHDDCHDIRQSVSPLTKSEQHNNNEESTTTDPCTAALEELARGVASLATADCPEERCDGVFLRIVCASNYKARDPMFHTDKAPLRGYVTLRGVGTEFMKRPCSPLEYVALRSVGVLSNDSNDLRQARELEFIVMKGDYYESPATTTTASWLKGAGQLWHGPPHVCIVLHQQLRLVDDESLFLWIWQMVTMIVNGMKLIRSENGAVA